jgi:hypothetical protein
MKDPELPKRKNKLPYAYRYVRYIFKCIYYTLIPIVPLPKEDENN